MAAATLAACGHAGRQAKLDTVLSSSPSVSRTATAHPSEPPALPAIAGIPLYSELRSGSLARVKVLGASGKPALKIAMSCIGPGEVTIKSAGVMVVSTTCDSLYTNTADVPAGKADLARLSVDASPATTWRIGLYLPAAS